MQQLYTKTMPAGNGQSRANGGGATTKGGRRDA
jgi:hypothetical protein